MRLAPLLACVSMMTFGCYASHAPSRGVTGDGCALPDGLVSPLVETTGDGHCVLTGPDASDTIWTSDCDGAMCTMYVDGVPTCDCDTFDFSNTCSNGIPTCLGWAIFDFSHVTFESED